MMDIEIPTWWEAEEEHRMSEIDSITYKGYYVDRGGVRFVGLVIVNPAYRDKGLFKHLLDIEFKGGVDAVVLLSVTQRTKQLAQRYGYVYDADRNVSIWERE